MCSVLNVVFILWRLYVCWINQLLICYSIFGHLNLLILYLPKSFSSSFLHLVWFHSGLFILRNIVLLRLFKYSGFLQNSHEPCPMKALLQSKIPTQVSWKSKLCNRLFRRIYFFLFVTRLNRPSCFSTRAGSQIWARLKKKKTEKEKKHSVLL